MSKPIDWAFPRSDKDSTKVRHDFLQQRIDEYDRQHPAEKAPNFARAKALFPHSFGDQEKMWLERFDTEPELLWRMIGDVVRYVSSDEIPRGQRQSSLRKVQAKDRNLDAVWRIIHGNFSQDPFPVAVKELFYGRSERGFALACGLNKDTMRRYIAGSVPLTLEVLAAFAKGGRVDLFYFREARALWLSQLMFEAMMTQPNESIRAVKQLKVAVEG